MKNIMTVVAYLCLLLLQASCSDSTSKAPVSEPRAGSALSFAPPSLISDTKAINASNLRVEIRINGKLIDATKAEGSEVWFAQAYVEKGSEVFLSVTWYEDYQKNTRLDLAHWQETMQVDESLNVNIDSEDYITSNEVFIPANSYFEFKLQFDNDNDGFSNLAERDANSNALNIASTPPDIPVVDVIVPVSTVRSPRVDGNYSSADYETQNAAFNDTIGRRLSIDNLMVDTGTGSSSSPRANGDSEMIWFTIHDNEYLYFAVLGEDIEFSRPQRDSEIAEVWNDDNLNIFLDTDYSADREYDGINDYHIMIPLLNQSGSANVSNGNGDLVFSTNSALLDAGDVQYATCGECGPTGQNFWEVRISLSSLGLLPGSVFGVDVQLDIDDDGGERDTKWGWFHPSGSDTTWRFPSMMAKGYLQ